MNASANNKVNHLIFIVEGSEKKKAFLAVIEGHKGIIYKVANAYAFNHEDRDDLVQEVFLQLWFSFDKYNSEYKYSTWIYRIALNVCISFLRKRKQHKPISGEVKDHLMDIAREDLEENEDLQLLNQFISKLRELDRAIIILYLEEKSHAQISEILGLSETNIATKISRIKKELKEQFDKIKNT